MPDQRHARRPGREHGVGHQGDRLGERHPLRAGPLGRDAVHPGGLDRDLTARVDKPGPAAHRHALNHRDQHVGHGHVAEAVDARCLEVEAEYLPLGPVSHPDEHASTM